MPLTVSKKKEMFKKADIDNDGKIDYEEFIKSVENDSYLSKETTFFRSAFCFADKDEDGLISIDEFR